MEYYDFLKKNGKIGMKVFIKDRLAFFWKKLDV